MSNLKKIKQISNHRQGPSKEIEFEYFVTWENQSQGEWCQLKLNKDNAHKIIKYWSDMDSKIQQKYRQTVHTLHIPDEMKLDNDINNSKLNVGKQEMYQEEEKKDVKNSQSTQDKDLIVTDLLKEEIKNKIMTQNVQMLKVKIIRTFNNGYCEVNVNLPNTIHVFGETYPTKYIINNDIVIEYYKKHKMDNNNNNNNSNSQ